MYPSHAWLPVATPSGTSCAWPTDPRLSRLSTLTLLSLSMLPLGYHHWQPTAALGWVPIVLLVDDIYRAPPYPLTLVPGPTLLGGPVTLSLVGTTARGDPNPPWTWLLPVTPICLPFPIELLIVYLPVARWHLRRDLCTFLMIALPALCSSVLLPARYHVAFKIHAFLANFGHLFLSTSTLRTVNTTLPYVCRRTVGVSNGHGILLTTYLQFRSPP